MNHLYLKKFQIGIWLADIDKNKINKNIIFNRDIKEFKFEIGMFKIILI